MAELAERATHAGQTHSMEMIFFPIFLLLFVGIIANNYASVGIQTNPTLITPCQSIAICYPTNTNGCDNNVQNCNFTSKTSFSFLNANSPFTLLVEGNVIGFFSGIFLQGENQNQIFSGYTICIPQINGVYANATGINIHNFQCLGYTANGVGNHPFPQTGIPLNATSNNGNNSNWGINGCNLSSTQTYPCTLNYGNGIESFNGTRSNANFYGFYALNGTTFSQSATCSIFSSLFKCSVALSYLFFSSSTFTCPNTGHVNGININATHYYCLLPVVNPTLPTNSSSVTQSLGNSFGALGFISGMILVFLGFGLALTSALIGFSINDQGTKLAQAMGIGLVVWSFIYSEFGQTWLPNLPFNLGTIGFIGLTAMFFMGLYWRVFTLD